MSTISSGTTSTTTLIHSGDTTGNLVFKTNDTGSGGTEAMRIDTSQNVGIGTSSPTNALTVGTTSSGKNIAIYSSSNGNNGLLRMYDLGGTERLQLGVSSTGEATYYAPTGSVHAWYVNTERMRIDSSGNLLLGATSAQTSGKIQALPVNNDSYECVTADGSSSGDYGIGWTISNNGHRFVRLTSSYESSAGTGQGSFFIQTKSTGGSLRNVFKAGPDGVITFSLYGAGTLTTSASGVISASDGRYKTKTRQIDNALSIIEQLTPTYYRWDEGTPFYNEGYEELGFIAQEVATVIPEASPGIDTLDEEKFRNYSDRAVIAVLVASIQELKAINDQQAQKITALTARVVALEGK